MHRRTLSLAALFTVLLAACASAPGPGRDWVALGQRSVTDRLDHDHITVTARRGDFRRLKITVERAPVEISRMVVHYGNGERHAVQLRARIGAGGESRAIDLPGRDRVIRSVEFWYDAETLGGRQAVVRLWGLR